MTNSHVVKIYPSYFDLFKFYQHDPKFYPTLLQSVAGNPQFTRFDILFLAPKQKLILDQQFVLSLQDQTSEQSLDLNHCSKDSHNFLAKFNQLWTQEKQAYFATANKDNTNSVDYPFFGGWFLSLSYELVHQIEKKLPILASEDDFPIAYACRYSSALIYDQLKQELVLIAETEQELTDLSKRVKDDLQLILKKESEAKTKAKTKVKVDLFEDEPQAFIDAAKKIKQYIYQGDVFQVNLSRMWQATISADNLFKLAADIYLVLREKNPAPFACCVNLDEHVIISSSPERLLKVKNNILESRPIAGTRPRSDNKQRDEEYIQQLHANAKEQSEHIMLLDLIRNDLGKVCKSGSIKVDELMINESYQTVHHIVSNIKGELAENSSPADVLAALFPGGTITGCPKVRCMEIINELEQVPRKAYTGSVGYINHDGSMDFNILIRSMLLSEQKSVDIVLAEKNDEQKSFNLSFRAGAGLVYDSVAEHELKETRTKAKGLINALLSMDDE